MSTETFNDLKYLMLAWETQSLEHVNIRVLTGVQSNYENAVLGIIFQLCTFFPNQNKVIQSNTYSGTYSGIK